MSWVNSLTSVGTALMESTEQYAKDLASQLNGEVQNISPNSKMKRPTNNGGVENQTDSDGFSNTVLFSASSNPQLSNTVLILSSIYIIQYVMSGFIITTPI